MHCVYTIYAHVYFAVVCVCLSASGHLPVENPHSALWACRMSSTVDVPLFQGNIISYFYMEFTLTLWAEPPPRVLRSSSNDVRSLYTHTHTHTAHFTGEWKWHIFLNGVSFLSEIHLWICEGKHRLCAVNNKVHNSSIFYCLIQCTEWTLFVLLKLLWICNFIPK